MKYFFFDDYSEGAHPDILDALVRTNLEQKRGYGEDTYAIEAERLIREHIQKPDANVHFVASGTQANIICLASMLKPYESVIATDYGHISVHEAGAIEATGHKINTVPHVAGKITPEAVLEVLRLHPDEHTVSPKVVYISQVTEFGTVYNKKELEALYQVCQKNNLYLYVDGARLGHALMSKYADFTLSDIADVCDMFYIGGTKNGALIGEAIVVVNPELQVQFRRHLRQRGALLAKARVASVQFCEFFKDNLYFENALNANQMAQKLGEGITRCGYTLPNETVANQVFAILPNEVIESLEEDFGFYRWDKINEEFTMIRLVTSWATQESAVDAFLDKILGA